jgi:Protein of unknown function (DUF642)
MRGSLFCAIWVALALAVPCSGSIVNGSFESFVGTDTAGDADGLGRTVYGSGSSGVTGWTLSGTGDVYLHHTPDIGNTIGQEFNFAQAGSTYLDLSGGIGGGVSGQHAVISQAFATVPTELYELSFYIGAARSPSASINVQLLGASNLLNSTLTALAPSTNINWSLKTFVFTANSTTTTLSFHDTSNNDDNYSFVDNVSVSQVAVPEPSNLVTWSILLASSMTYSIRARRWPSEQRLS